MSDQPWRADRDDELADAPTGIGLRLADLDWAGMLTAPGIRAIAGIVLGVLVLAWQGADDRGLTIALGAGLVVFGATSALTTWQDRSWEAGAKTAAGLVLGVLILIGGERSEVALGRIFGAIIVVWSLGGLVRQRPWPGLPVVTTRLAVAAAGSVLMAFPAEILSGLTWLVAIGWILFSVVALVAIVDRSLDAHDYDAAGALIWDWLLERPKAVEERHSLYDKIIFEGSATRTRVLRFLALMTFASVISAMGIVTDSTAVVIGAMLIAPLMTPLMAMAISLVMGWPNRLARAGLIAACGILLAIAIGFAIGLLLPDVVDVVSNSQITSRSDPTLLDLVVAVAAGAAGAYGLSRPDVSDALPGVAIAISLVPPLSVVGITYSLGETEAGNGALLLFTTNAVAILIVGGLTFVLLGVTPIAQVAANQHRVRTSMATVSILGSIVVGSLLLNGSRSASNLVERSQLEAEVLEWLSPSEAHALEEVSLRDSDVRVRVRGPEDGLPNVDVLAADLETHLGRAVRVEVLLDVQNRFVAVTTDD